MLLHGRSKSIIMECKKCGSLNAKSNTIVNLSGTTIIETCDNCNNVEVKSTSPKIDTSLLNII